MYKDEAFLKELFKEIPKFDFEGERLYTQKVEVGGLAIDDGMLLVCDPYKVHLGVTVANDIKQGVYPVHIFSATFPPHDEHKILALKVSLKEEVPDIFKMALPEGMVEESVPEGSFYGVQSESGTVMILDRLTCKYLITEVEDSYPLLKELEEKLSLTYFEVGGMADVKLPNQEKNFMCAISGNDKGAFPIYLGYKDDELVSIIIDFLNLAEEV